MENNNLFNAKPLGQAIKKARKKDKLTREKIAEMVGRSPRHILAIENNGAHPSLQILYQLVTFFSIPVDQFFFPANEDKSTRRLQIENSLNKLDEKDYIVLEATIRGLLEAKGG